ncbi:MAG: hypothetical protein ACOH1V_08760 [Stenotrophomonas sp.]
MSTSILLLGVLFSSIGLGYFIYGKKQRAINPLICGLALMLIPYCLSSVALLLIAGATLCAIPWLFRS